MADLITRLKLESGEYDSKIKRAGQELLAYGERCKKIGLQMGYANQDAKDFAKALGSMQTVSTSARGKINELSEAFINLKAMYKNMTNEEKNNEFGKNLAASLDKLKTRINDSKKELNDINAELGNTGKASSSTGGFVDALTQKLTINFDALTMLDKGLGLVNKGLDVAKEAFFSSEANVDAWGRTIASNESLYRSFLTTLNNSDISGFLGRIDQIIDAARKAYDELDRLGTMKTIQGPAVSAQQTENERMRMMIQTGRYIAPVDGRRASMANGTMLTADQIRSIEQKLQQGMTKIVSLTSNEVKQTGRAIDAVYNRMAKENNMSMREFRKGTSSMEEFDKRMKGYEQYQKYEREHTITSTRYDPHTGDYDTFTYRDQTKNPYQQYRNWGTFRVDAMGKGSYNELVDLIRQRDQQAAQAYGMQSQAFRTMNRAEGITVSKIMRGKTAGTGGGKKGGSKQSPAEKAQEKYAQAQQDYNQAIQQASLEVKADMISVSEANKKKLSATETLWKAIGDAREIYDTQQLKDAQKKVETEMINLGGAVKRAAADTKPIKPVETTMSKFESGPFNSQTMKAYLSGMQSQMGKFDLGSEFYTAFNDKLTEGNALSQILQQAMASGVKGADLENVSQLIKDKLLQGGTMSPQSMQSLIDDINQYIQDNNLKLVLEVDAETGKIKDVTTEIMKQKDAWNKTGMAMGVVSQAFNSIQDPAAKIMGTVAQAIANVALAYSDAMAKDQTTKFNLFAFIAAASAATIGMISTIASIHSATGYAQGGIVDGSRGGFVGGSAYSGDQVGNVRLNSGELVLSRSQQFNLASQLEGDGNQGTTPSRPYVSGEQIYLGLNNYLRRSGRGEIVTSR